MAVLGQQGVHLGGVDEAAEQVGDLAARVPRLVVLEAALVALEQHRRRARRSICSAIVSSPGSSSPVSQCSSPSSTRQAPAS